MTFAGYNPEEAVRFWEHMEQLTRGREPPEILSDHPSDAHRIQDIEKWIPKALAAKKAYDQGNIAGAEFWRSNAVPPSKAWQSNLRSCRGKGYSKGRTS